LKFSLNPVSHKGLRGFHLLQKSETDEKLRLPRPFGGVNVNFCKNPLCSNFGKEAELKDQRGKKRGEQRSLYSVGGKGTGLSLHCQSCGAHSVVKSNKAVYEEFERNLEQLVTPGGLHCPTVTCANYFRPVDSHPESYLAHGRTATGAKRYRCKACRKTLSDGRRHHRQKTSHENKTVFQMLVAKVCITRIAQITGLGPATVYDKIDFLHDQCRKFVADRERRMPQMWFKRMRIATDMQDYMVNWPTKKLRKTIQFRAIASSCLNTGYVLACHPQIDSRFNTHDIQMAVVDCGDLDKNPAFREYARLWTYEDYEKSLQLDPGVFRPTRGGPRWRRAHDEGSPAS